MTADELRDALLQLLDELAQDRYDSASVLSLIEAAGNYAEEEPS